MKNFTDINQQILFIWCVLWKNFDIKTIMQLSAFITIKKLESQIRLETSYTGDAPHLYILLHRIVKFG